MLDILQILMKGLIFIIADTLGEGHIQAKHLIGKFFCSFLVRQFPVLFILNQR